MRPGSFGELLKHFRIAAALSQEALAVRRPRTRKCSSPETLLLPIADAMANVVCDENFAHIKRCEDAGALEKTEEPRD
jgi:predicted RNA-binding Zn ribbon-like protein